VRARGFAEIYNGEHPLDILKTFTYRPHLPTSMEQITSESDSLRQAALHPIRNLSPLDINMSVRSVDANRMEDMYSSGWDSNGLQ
jgi:hypothetical protein